MDVKRRERGHTRDRRTFLKDTCRGSDVDMDAQVVDSPYDHGMLQERWKKVLHPSMSIIETLLQSFSKSVVEAMQS